VSASLPSLDELLDKLSAVGGSDLHLKVGSPPVFRINGVVHRAELPVLAPQDTDHYLAGIITDRAKEAFEGHGEAEFAISRPGRGRFRVSSYRQRGSVSLVLRSVSPVKGTFRELGLPADVLEKLSDERPGLVFITGPAGSGKTTTAGAVVNRINATRRATIVTLEDPIEILFPDQQSIVSQREIGSDTESYSAGLTAAVNQDTDVIFVGGLPDEATVTAALDAAETGHLVIAVIPTFDGVETINRLIEYFAPHRQTKIRKALATNIKGILSQQLIPRADGKGRVAAVEVLVNTERVKTRIADPDALGKIVEDIAEGDFFGMRSYDQAILKLYDSGEITFEAAQAHAASVQDFKAAAQGRRLERVAT
jgi:twitching motility protein PilT